MPSSAPARSKIDSFTVRQKLVLSKNDKYWNAKALKVAGMEVRPGLQGGTATRVAAVQAGTARPHRLNRAEQLTGLSGDVKPISVVSRTT